MMRGLRVWIEAFGDTVLAVVRRDPGVTTEQTLLIVSLFLVLMAVLIVAILLFATPVKRKVVRRRVLVPASEASAASVAEDTEAGEAMLAEPEAVVAEPGAEPGPEPSTQAAGASRRRAGLAGLIALLLVAIVVVTHGVTGQDAYCAYCHAGGQMSVPEQFVPLTATVTYRTDPSEDLGHDTGCASCHGRGIVADLAGRVRMVVSWAGGTGPGARTAVLDARRCAGCHRAVLTEVTSGETSGVRMSHAEPQAAGVHCIECHHRIGHEDAKDPTMASCLECHDGEQAAAECALCHLGNPSDAAVGDDGELRTKLIYRAVPLDSGNCYACHDPAPCDSCHQTRMPHTAQYGRGGGHAYDAAWDKKESCYRCHLEAQCNDCHLPFASTTNHYAGWRRDHVNQSPNAACPCHDQRRPATGPRRPFCQACH